MVSYSAIEQVDYSTIKPIHLQAEGFTESIIKYIYPDNGNIEELRVTFFGHIEMCEKICLN